MPINECQRSCWTPDAAWILGLYRPEITPFLFSDGRRSVGRIFKSGWGICGSSWFSGWWLLLRFASFHGPIDIHYSNEKAMPTPRLRRRRITGSSSRGSGDGRTTSPAYSEADSRCARIF